MRLYAVSNLPWDSYYPEGVTSPLGAERRTHRSAADGVAPWLLPAARARLTGEGVGGSPTNVALACAAAGAEVTVVGPVADDPWGARVRHDVERHGVRLVAVTPPPPHQAHSVAFMEPGGERRFLATMPAWPEGTRVTAPGFTPAGPGWWTSSAYELADEGLARFLLESSWAAARAGLRLAFDLADPDFVAAREDWVWALVTSELEVLFTGPEALGVLVPGGLAAPWTRIAGLARYVIVSRGAAGVRLYDRAGARDFPAAAVPVQDTTGAGDACLAGCLLGLADGATPDRAVERGLAAAARCLGELGAR